MLFLIVCVLAKGESEMKKLKMLILRDAPCAVSESKVKINCLLNSGEIGELKLNYRRRLMNECE